MNVFFYFILFIIYSFIGWAIEMIYTFLGTKKLVNRGFLIGPYCPIYGWGGVLMTLLLNRYVEDPIVLFFMAMVICSILEYSTSFIMEKLFKTRWWDYSEKKFNINGRICLETMVPFGILGCLLMYFINPFISNIINSIPSNVLMAIAIILFMIFLIDNIVSFSIISKITASAKKMVKDNTEEITKKVREYIANYSKFGNRLTNSFPKIKILERYRSKRNK